MMASWDKCVSHGVAKFAFKANGKYQLDLEIGDQVVTEEHSGGWYKGVRVKTGKRGIFPAAFIQIDQTSGQDPVKVDTLKHEVDEILKGWSKDLRAACMDIGARRRYHEIQSRISVLSEWRRLVWSENNGISEEMKSMLRTSIVKLVEASAQLKAGHIVPRNTEGKVADGSNTSLIGMYRMHADLQHTLDEGADLPTRISEIESAVPGSEGFRLRRLQRRLLKHEVRGSIELSTTSDNRTTIITTTTTKPTSSSSFSLDLEEEGKSEYDVYLEFKSMRLAGYDETGISLHFSIYSVAEGKYMTEEFLLRDLRTNRSTIFETFSRQELEHSSLVLVCKIFRTGDLLQVNRPGEYRRPVGVAIWFFADFLLDLMSGPSILECGAISIISSPNSGGTGVVGGTGNNTDIIGTKEEYLDSKLRQLLFENSNMNGKNPNKITICLNLLEKKRKTKGKTATTQRLDLDRFLPRGKRNDLFMTLVKGTFQQDRKRAARNVQVRVFLIENKTKRRNELFRSTVYYHDNSPTFGETIKLSNLSPSIPLADCRVVMVYYHASTNPSKTHPFGYSVLPLGVEEVLKQDGTRTLKSYEPIVSNGDIDWSSSAIMDPLKSQQRERMKEQIVIETLLCSNMESQERCVHNLTNFDDDLVGTMEQVGQLAPSAIMMSIEMILDSIFSIMELVEDDQVIEPAFDLLVHVISAGMHEFGEETFLQGFVGCCSSVRKKSFRSSLIGNIRLRLNDETKLDKLFVRCFAHLMHLVLINTGVGEKREILDIFYLLDDVMLMTSIDEDVKINAIQAMGEFFVIMTKKNDKTSKIFSLDEVGEIARGFLESITEDEDESSWKIAKAKLHLIEQLCKTVVIQSPLARKKVMAAFIRILQEHLEEDSIEQQELTGHCISQLLLDLRERDDIWNVSILLPDLFTVCYEAYTSNRMMKLAELFFTCALSILHDMDQQQLQYYMTTVIQSPEEMDHFMFCSLSACSDLLDKVYPESWFLLNSYKVKTMVKLLKWFAPRMCQVFTGGNIMEKNLWPMFLRLTLRIVNIAKEKEEPEKLLKQCWESSALVGNRWRLVKLLAKDLLFMMNSSYSRRMYFDLICEELATKQNLEMIERETIEFIEEEKKSNNSDLYEFFAVDLKAKNPNNAIPEIGAFLNHMIQLYQLLCDLDQLPMTPVFEYDRVDAIILILEYLEKLDERNVEPYCKQLSELHQQIGNYMEAGNALILLATKTSDNRADHGEEMMLASLDLFEKGNLWDNAIEVCDRLRRIYETKMFAYGKLGSLLLREAKFFTKKQQNDYYCYYTTYFHVVFTSNQKSYIYKGGVGETVSEFKEKLRIRYEEGNDNEIQVLSVKPEENYDHEQVIPSEVQKQQAYQKVTTFYSLKSYRKNTSNQNNEFLNTWVTKQKYIVEHAFPGLSRRAMIVRTETVELDPLHIAISNVYSKNCEIAQFLLDYQDMQERNAPQTFTMLLNGVIDAAVNGGVLKNYQTLLEESDALKKQLQTHLQLLEKAVKLHERICALDVLPLHNYLQDKFYKEMMKLKRLIIIG